MAQRITRKEIRKRLEYLNQRVGRSQPESIYALDIAYGGYKIVLRTPRGTETDISARLGAKEAYLFVQGMLNVLIQEGI